METSLRPGDESFTNVLSKNILGQKIIHQQRGNGILIEEFWETGSQQEKPR